MGPLHGPAAWVRCMGPLPPHSVACKPLRSNGHTLRAVSAAIAPVQPLPLTVWRVSHCVVMVTPCALCFGCSLKLKRTPLVATASVLCSVRHKPTSGEACELVSLSPSLGLPHRHQALRGPRGDQVVEALAVSDSLEDMKLGSLSPLACNHFYVIRVGSGVIAAAKHALQLGRIAVILIEAQCSDHRIWLGATSVLLGFGARLGHKVLVVRAQGSALRRWPERLGTERRACGNHPTRSNRAGVASRSDLSLTKLA